MTDIDDFSDNEKKLFANTRCIADFEKQQTIGEGTYGVVFCAIDKTSNQKVAIKKVKIHDPESGFSITSVREIKNLQLLSGHPNIVKLIEVVVGYRKNSIFLVFEYCLTDLGCLIDNMFKKKMQFTESEIKSLVFQLCNGLKYIHFNHQIHRDIKLSNLLINEQGILKIADFGLSRQYEKPDKLYTSKVVTLWYRAPEILLKFQKYDHKSDIWSVGCILAEFLNKGMPVFPGKNEINQIQLICELIGFPTQSEWQDFKKNGQKDIIQDLEKFKHLQKNNLTRIFPEISKNCLDLLNKLLAWNPEVFDFVKIIFQNNKRISMDECMLHPYFYEHPRPSLPQELKIMQKIQLSTDSDILTSKKIKLNE